jgi:hypothetical protein
VLVSADQPPSPSPLWTNALHLLAALPLLQFAAFLGSAVLISRRAANPSVHSTGPGRWFWLVVLPLLVDLGIASGLLWLAQGSFQLKLLYMPDLTYLALGCGVFSLLWGPARTVMMARAMRR